MCLKCGRIDPAYLLRVVQLCIKGRKQACGYVTSAQSDGWTWLASFAGNMSVRVRVCVSTLFVQSVIRRAI